MNLENYLLFSLRLRENVKLTKEAIEVLLKNCTNNVKKAFAICLKPG